jgi:hypothetical protein
MTWVDMRGRAVQDVTTVAKRSFETFAIGQRWLGSASENLPRHQGEA